MPSFASSFCLSTTPKLAYSKKIGALESDKVPISASSDYANLKRVKGFSPPAVSPLKHSVFCKIGLSFCSNFCELECEIDTGGVDGADFGFA